MRDREMRGRCGTGSLIFQGTTSRAEKCLILSPGADLHNSQGNFSQLSSSRVPPPNLPTKCATKNCQSGRLRIGCATKWAPISLGRRSILLNNPQHEDVLDRHLPLYPNYRNYLYPVPGSPRFLLFNPAIHYWLSLNSSAAEIMRAMEGPTSLTDLQLHLRHQQGVTDEEFEQSVVPFVRNLLSDGFLASQAAQENGSWQLRRPSLESPEEYPWEDIIVSLGDRCNLACPYCFNQKERQDRLLTKNLRRIGRADIARILAEFRDLGGKGVIFTGGEPTLNPMFLEICEDAVALGITVKVITNGTQLKRLDAARVAEAVDVLAVSLDSADDSVNAILWGNNKYRIHDHLLAPLAQIGRIRRQRDGEKIGITIKPTITRHNLHGLPDLARHVAEALVDCNVRFDITSYHEIDSCGTNTQLAISREEFEAALATFARSAGRNDTEAGIFAMSLAGKLEGIERPRVLSCAPSLFVTNDGGIYPCQMLENSEFLLGNAFDVGLREAFTRPRFIELRDRMTRDDIEICRECEFRYVCVEHCHGCAHKETGRTTAFLQPSELVCRTRMVKRLWLQTQRSALQVVSS
jgi:radical SAM protein with 4Fe4S-binding SPASM domain